MTGPELAVAIRKVLYQDDPDQYGEGVKVRLPYSEEGRTLLYREMEAWAEAAEKLGAPDGTD